MLDDRAAARAERQALDVKLLRARIADRVRRADRARGAALPTACALRLRAALKNWSMNDGDTVQRVRDVVEAVLGAVDGQQRRGVDVEREQIADRVRVLRAVQRCGVT